MAPDQAHENTYAQNIMSRLYDGPQRQIRLVAGLASMVIELTEDGTPALEVKAHLLAKFNARFGTKIDPQTVYLRR